MEFTNIYLRVVFIYVCHYVYTTRPFSLSTVLFLSFYSLCWALSPLFIKLRNDLRNSSFSAITKRMSRLLITCSMKELALEVKINFSKLVRINLINCVSYLSESPPPHLSLISCCQSPIFLLDPLLHLYVIVMNHTRNHRSLTHNKEKHKQV